MVKIYNDIRKKNIIGRAVIVMSLSLPASEFDLKNPWDQAFHQEFFGWLTDLDKLGAAIVVSMPNFESCVGPPCIYGDPNNSLHLPNLIVVGGGYIADGTYAPNNPNRESWITIYGLVRMSSL